MTATTLLRELEHRQVILEANGERLRWKARRGVLTDELLRALSAHKSEVLALLHAPVPASSTQPMPSSMVDREAMEQADSLALMKDAPEQPTATTPLDVRKPSAIESVPVPDPTPRGLSQRLQKYLPLVNAAQDDALPLGPIVIDHGVTLIDPKLFVLAAWRHLTHFAGMTTTLHRTIRAGIDERCEWLDALADQSDFARWAETYS